MSLFLTSEFISETGSKPFRKRILKTNFSPPAHDPEKWIRVSPAILPKQTAGCLREAIRRKHQAIVFTRIFSRLI
ncbi:hypothetical protein [Mesorhizobium sp. B2-1-3A]|uniref:hypothetical protein n=1 Tax=Mesorhizobium sp. B2-1-3A TaxID=2589971 RepID=UPI001125D8F0|nr:hypothetical protein [Mesorhizobium sp. B2-1-3A]TPM99728.1 hypothetical protein FJ977_10115 [Mesorhizobium sp. B2-1-3A]